MAENNTQEGYLVLSDISGYTSFLTHAELDHAREIIADLLQLITQRFKSLLTISKFEGDAIFAYAPDKRITRGELLVEVLESAYQAFRDRIQSSKRMSACSCRGCQAMPTLDLKFMVHYGQYAFQEVAGHRDLVGHDVILVHRLLKNHVTEKTGSRAYSLFTKPALNRIGTASDGLTQQEESYEHIGTLEIFVADLKARYEEIVAARRVMLSREDATCILISDYDAPPPFVWDWLNDPRKRMLWSGVEVRPLLRPGGRMKQGAENHCIHGKEVSLEKIVDWRPFDYFTVEVTTTLGLLRTTYALEHTDRGTRLEDRSMLEPRLGVLKPFSGLILKILYRIINARGQYERLGLLISEEAHVELPREAESIPSDEY